MPINAGQRLRRADLSLSWPARIKGLTKVLKGALFLTLLFNCIQAMGVTVPAGQSVTLAWEPSSDTNVVGYNIYYGMTSHTYSNMVNVGNATNATISGLVGGATYYFAATAYDNLGDESDFSDEIIYLVPYRSTMQIHSPVAGQFILTVTGQTGHTYKIQATQDFKTWTTIGSMTMGAGGSLDFIDTNAQNFSERFYRTCDDQSTTPSGTPVLQIRGTTAGQFILTATGQTGHTYEIQATQDFKTWTIIGSVTMGAGGSLDFTDTNARNFQERFYRTHDTQP
jgi:hypothetical protein